MKKFQNRNQKKALSMLTALELLILQNDDLEYREQLTYSKLLREVKAYIRPVSKKHLLHTHYTPTTHNK